MAPEHVEKGLLITSLVVALLGYLPNTISLIYFCKYERKKLAGQLMITLNVIDLLACVCIIITTIIHLEAECYGESCDIDDVLLLTMGVSQNFSVLSGWVTCVLAFSRTLAITRPLRAQSRALVHVSVAVGLIIEGAITTTCCYLYSRGDTWLQKNYSISEDDFQDTYIQSMAIQILAFLAGTLCCIVVSAAQLYRTTMVTETTFRRTNTGRVSCSNVAVMGAVKTDATVTMIWLGAVFIVTNSVIVCSLVESLRKYGDEIILVAMSLNSALNPCVYIARRYGQIRSCILAVCR